MRLKDLFTVPEGQKVTEKYFHRVLISSICSILLCMSCLAGTTWAWFTVSIENQGNEIQIVDLAERVIRVDSGTQVETPVSKEDGGYPLEAGANYTVNIKVDGKAESALVPVDLRPYVVMTLKLNSGGEQVYYAERQLMATIPGLEATVSFKALWSKTAPDGTPVGTNQMLTISEATTTPSDTTVGEGTTDPSVTTAPPAAEDTTVTTSAATPEASEPEPSTAPPESSETTTETTAETTAGNTEETTTQTTEAPTESTTPPTDAPTQPSDQESSATENGA